MELELFVFLFVSFFRGLSPLLTSGRCASLDIQRLDKDGSETSAENATIRVSCRIKSSCNKNDVFVILGKNEPNALRCAVMFANETCIPSRPSSFASQSNCSCAADTVTTNFTQTASQSHSGQWYCSVQVEPSYETERITITYPCPPKIEWVNFTQNEQEPTSLKLGIRAHTADIQDCKINSLYTEAPCNVVAVTGTPPDLVLTVRLDNVRKEEEGQWTLTLTNDAGSAHWDLRLNVTEDQTTSNASPVTRLSTVVQTTDDEHSNNANSYFSVDANVVIGAGTAAVLFVFLNVTICIYCATKARKNVQRPAASQELAVMPDSPSSVRQSAAFEAQASGQSVHEYFYVPDSPPSSNEEEFADQVAPPLPCRGQENEPDDYLEPSHDETEAPPAVCHGPGKPPDDYLVPAPSRDETEDEGTEWKTVRYYENTQLRPVLRATGNSYCATADKQDADT